MRDFILDIDIGNSYAKWRLGSAQSARIKNDQLSELSKIIGQRVDRVRMACVLDEAHKSSIKSTLQLDFGCDVEVARPLLLSHGMKNGYKNIEALGVDRWLASLAAFKYSSGAPCLVVDIGSALTIDTVDDHGVYVGGYIIPGLMLMQSSLLNGTGRIACETDYGLRHDFLEVPSDTANAVQRGACFALVACVEKAIDNFLSKWGHGTVHLTGGDGSGVATYLGREVDYRGDLVLDGLNLAIP
jgi:type III pantothenate kinase